MLQWRAAKIHKINKWFIQGGDEEENESVLSQDPVFHFLSFCLHRSSSLLCGFAALSEVYPQNPPPSATNLPSLRARFSGDANKCNPNDSFTCGLILIQTLPQGYFVYCHHSCCQTWHRLSLSQRLGKELPWHPCRVPLTSNQVTL